MVKFLDKIGIRKEEQTLREGTEDPVLNMLRNQRQKIAERDEKKQLTEEIREDRRTQLRTGLFGVKGNADRKVNLLKDTRKSTTSILNERPLLKEKNILKDNNILKGNNIMQNKTNVLKSERKRKELNLLSSKTRLL
ncbi:hypothetical protein LCGC14_0374600 [marine sediment metagenome]|uniref:Uncharacterized protein n=1 Tax=marine sediment metagenome TaxID=412755 RepID=A0A0F9T482_9ZZZZ